jgi:hypothetical protein
MKKLPALILLAVVSLSLGACVAERPVRRHAAVEVTVRPPEPRVLIVPAPRAGYVWAPGFWRWNGRAHVWVDGRWLREQSGKHWVPAHWEEGRRGYWHFEEGHWER